MQTLDPGWVAEVPPMFRSAADSIEGHRARLLGDPGALRATAARWRAAAAQVDGLWHSVDGGRAELRAAWEGDAAVTAGARAAALDGELAASATSLTFAADGLDLAAAAVQGCTAAADAGVRRYVTSLRLLYSWARSAPPAGQAEALAVLVRRGTALGVATLHEVYAQEVELDHVMASMPRRFVVGPAAPWRATLKTGTDLSVDGGFTAALTIDGVRVTRGEGLYVVTNQDGRVVVAFTDVYGVGEHLSAGAKVSFDKLPKALRDLLQRHYGEAEGGATLAYSQRYAFADQAHAQAFLDRLEGTGAGAHALARLRDAAGFVLGPVSDAGPWHRELMGRDPDEVTFSVGLAGKANGDAGAWPLGGAGAATSADGSLTVSLRRSGDSSLAVSTSAGGKAGATLLGHTATTGEVAGHVGRVDYDSHGAPVRYTSQVLTTRDYDYRFGTGSGYVGAGSAPTPALPKGAHVKADDEAATRSLRAQVLDLRRPEDRAAFDRALGRDPTAVVPVPIADPDLQRHLDQRATVVRQTLGLERGAGDLSATVGLGPLTFGAKAGTSREEQRLLDAWYADPTDPHGRDAAGRLLFRPYPRDGAGPHRETTH